MPDVTQILSRIDTGDPVAAEQLLPLVYEELKKLAAAKLAHEKPGQTLQATALVHEAYLRLVGPTGDGQPWNGRGHFFGAAAEAMRRILVDQARRKSAIKQGGEHLRIELLDQVETFDGDRINLLALNEALAKLDAEQPEKARLVKLRFFAGLSLEETAELLGISRATAQRSWAFARAWLFGQLNGD